MRLNTKDMLHIALFASLTSIKAFIKIETPLVPITLQFAFCAYAGLILGAKKGMASQAFYVIIGLIGFPVFARGGGPFYIFEPTFGYLLGFIVAAYVIGKMTETLKDYKIKMAFLKMGAAVSIGLLIVYTTGVIYLYGILNLHLESPINIKGALLVGVAPFILGDVILSALVILTAKRVMPTIDRYVYKPSPA